MLTFWFEVTIEHSLIRSEETTSLLLLLLAPKLVEHSTSIVIYDGETKV